MVAEIITVERRRRWKLADKVRLVSETLQPGASVSQVARRHGLHPSQLFAWRKLARDGGLRAAAEAEYEPAFTPVVISWEPPVVEAASPEAALEQNCSDDDRARSGRMEIALGRGRRVTVFADVNAAALARVIDVLDGR